MNRMKTSRSTKNNHRLAHKVGFLNEDTPLGLFEADNGNKYIVVDHNMLGDNRMFRVAVAIVHHSLPPFTWHALDEQPVAAGCWYGPYQIRLLNALAEDCVTGSPGVISTGDRHASIQCKNLDGRVQMVSIGYVGRKGLASRDFDGWALETTELRERFFEIGPQGESNVVLEPRSSPKGDASFANTFKQMVMDGILEKLAQPNSTKVSYKITDSFLRREGASLGEL